MALEMMIKIEHIDPGVIGATKNKLRYWLADRLGICLSGESAQNCIDVLIEIATEIRCKAAAADAFYLLCFTESLKSDLWAWILAHVTLPIAATDLLPWAIALEDLAMEVRQKAGLAQQ